MEWWGIWIIQKTWLQKLNFKMTFQYDSRPSNSIFKRIGMEKPFMPAVSFVSLLLLGDSTIRHELLGFSVFLLWKVSDLNLTDLHPKLRTVKHVDYPNFILFHCARRRWPSSASSGSAWRVIIRARFMTLSAKIRAGVYIHMCNYLCMCKYIYMIHSIN